MTKPLLIAEISSNHNMRLSRALDLISAAADAGATHAKFQAWQADLYYSRHHPALHARARAGQIPESWWHTLAMHCQRKGVDFLCTAFDTASLDIIDPYVDLHKIASGDLTNTQLLRAVAAKHKPVILSTGAATVPEIEAAVSANPPNGQSWLGHAPAGSWRDTGFPVVFMCRFLFPSEV